MQLDIFEHSRDVMLRNDVLQALERFDAPRSRVCWQALALDYPCDDALRCTRPARGPHAAAHS